MDLMQADQDLADADTALQNQINTNAQDIMDLQDAIAGVVPVYDFFNVN